MAYTLNPYNTLPYGQGTAFKPNDSFGIVNFATGSIVMDGTTPVAATVPLGFKPRKVRIIDITGGTTYAVVEATDMMPAGTTLVQASSGALTINTSSLITVNDPQPDTGNGRSFTLAATMLTASHTYQFEAWA